MSEGELERLVATVVDEHRPERQPSFEELTARWRRRRSLRRASIMAAVVVVATAVLVPVALPKGAGHQGSAPSPSASPAPGLVPDGYTGRFRLAATVMESPTHGPRLCMIVMTSWVPQCGGFDIAGWTWEGLTNESMQGTTWGTYVITGTFDGHTFALTEPAAVDNGQFTPHRRSSQDFDPPCPVPVGGWRPIDPTKVSQDALSAADAVANADPDFAGTWNAGNLPRAVVSPEDPAPFVLVVFYTKDLARHEADLRTVWGGALCVFQVRHTMAELSNIADQLPIGQWEGVGVDIIHGTVEFHVLVATQARQAELDAKYGPGMVRLIGYFDPID